MGAVIIEGQETSQERGLITKAFFDKALEQSSYYRHLPAGYIVEHSPKYIRCKIGDYLPFYTLNYEFPAGLPATRLVEGKVEYKRTVNALVNKFQASWKFNRPYMEFLNKCLKKNLYNVLLFTPHELVKDGNSRKIKRIVKAEFDKFMAKPYLPHMLKEGDAKVVLAGYENFVACCKYLNAWAYMPLRIKPVAPARSRGNIVYDRLVTNMYYAAATTSSLYMMRPGMLEPVTEIGPLTPLFVLMAKKEYMPYIRGCFITNTGIPVDKVELWIDESFDRVDSPYKGLRTAFVKFIKTPLAAIGVQVKVFPCLGDELYDYLDRPLFRTVGEEVQWQSELGKRFGEHFLDCITKEVAFPNYRDVPNEYDAFSLSKLLSTTPKKVELLQQKFEQELKEVLI